MGGCAQSPPPEVPAILVNKNIQVGATPEASTTYTGRTTIVQPGDNLYSISFVAGLDYRDVAEWNGFAHPEVKIFPGQEIRLYPPEGETVTGYQQQTQTQTPTLSEDKVTPYNPQQTSQPQPKQTSQPVTVPAATSTPSKWIWPAQGDIVANFSKTDRRNGIHIAGTSGAPIRASADGQVVYSGTGLIGYGRIIIVKHNPQFLSVYAHNSRVVVKEGDSVAQGQKIAEMGNTDSDIVKLHFEIRSNGTPVDPLGYLPKG